MVLYGLLLRCCKLTGKVKLGFELFISVSFSPNLILKLAAQGTLYDLITFEKLSMPINTCLFCFGLSSLFSHPLLFLILSSLLPSSHFPLLSFSFTSLHLSFLSSFISIWTITMYTPVQVLVFLLVVYPSPTCFNSISCIISPDKIS